MKSKFKENLYNFYIKEFKVDKVINNIKTIKLGYSIYFSIFVLRCYHHDSEKK